ADAAAGRGRIALLGGEPGIGKTRLAEELAADASALGAVVVWGRCYDGRGAPAFWPWTQVVHGLLGRYADGELTAALGAGIADVGGGAFRRGDPADRRDAVGRARGAGPPSGRAAGAAGGTRPRRPGPHPVGRRRRAERRPAGDRPPPHGGQPVLRDGDPAAPS